MSGKITILYGVFFFCTIGILRGQYQAANWVMDYNYLILKITPDTFEEYGLYYPPGGYGPNNSTGWIAESNVSDSSGNLLLYSFGQDVRNKFGTTISGGESICESTQYPQLCNPGYQPGSSILQGVLILPRPGNPGQYYLFNKDMFSGTDTVVPTRVTAALIDAYANSDSGVVIYSDSAILYGSVACTRMTACQNGNGRDWWLINHEYNSNKIYTHLITPDTIEGPFEQNIGLSGGKGDIQGGWATFSPTSDIYAYSTYGMQAITLLDFDRCSGTFGNFRNIQTVPDTTWAWSLAFSPNGRYLYGMNSNFLWQYDLLNIDSSLPYIEVAKDTATNSYFGSIVTMPDGKIYLSGASYTDSSLSVIDSPNLKCPDCGFHFHGVRVPNSLMIVNVPNLPNYNLGPVKGSACDTITGIQEPRTRNQELKIIPNPADGYVVISYRAAAAADEPPILTICNPLGQPVYQQTLPMYSGLQKIEVSNWAGGIYMVFIKRSGAVIATGKFVKQ